MNTDFRIHVGFFSHPKVQKLQRRLGDSAIVGLLRIYAHAAQHKHDGRLLGMSIEDIEITADWDPQKREELVKVLHELRLLDFEGDAYSIHDWLAHNPYVVHAADRSEHARRANHERWRKQEGHVCSERCPGYLPVIHSDTPSITPSIPTDTPSIPTDTSGNTPPPPPTPPPTPPPKESASRQRDELKTWFDTVLVPTFPKESQCQLKAGLAALRKINPDQAARDALVARVKAWTPVWIACGRYPGIHSFLTEGRYQGPPTDLRSGFNPNSKALSAASTERNPCHVLKPLRDFTRSSTP